MRIAIDARYLTDAYSGIAKYSENLLAALSQVDTSNEYVVFIHSSYNRRLRVGDNFTVEPYPARPVSVRTLAMFGDRVRRAECDFLHSLSPVAPLFGAKRLILTVHDLQPFTTQEEGAPVRHPTPSTIASLFHRITFPHFVRKATWLITVSQATKDVLARFFPEVEHKAITVHSGVEKTFFQPTEVTIAQMVSKKLDLPPQFILYIGSAQPNKNLPAMIRAFDRCRRESAGRLDNVQFLLVTPHDRYSAGSAKLARQMGLQDHVRLLGPVTEEEKRILYSRALLLFSVTRGEGFGFPIVEAQASGLPVLAANDASVPEVTGNTAMLVDPHDEERIASALGELLLDENTRSVLSAAGRTNVERFSWEQTARKVRDIYEMLM
jgi:glycosyltransferase involved in cell wall biosynthesis